MIYTDITGLYLLISVFLPLSLGAGSVHRIMDTSSIHPPSLSSLVIPGSSQRPPSVSSYPRSVASLLTVGASAEFSPVLSGGRPALGGEQLFIYSDANVFLFSGRSHDVKG